MGGIRFVKAGPISEARRVLRPAGHASPTAVPSRVFWLGRAAAQPEYPSQGSFYGSYNIPTDKIARQYSKWVASVK